VDILVIVLIVLLLVFGAGGYWVGRPGYAGPALRASTLLYVLAVIVLVIVILRLLKVTV